MFDLEAHISAWRQQMLAGGVKAPVPLDELENHLREDIEGQIQAGAEEQPAFENAARRIGQPAMLETEFYKAAETLPERAQKFVSSLLGIPNLQLVTPMNIIRLNPEPRWMTYLKTSAFVLPATFIWVGFCTLVLPKLKEICEVSGTALWKPITTALVVSDFIRVNLIVLTLVTLAALIYLEWRSDRWPRYRRLVFGILAYTINILALILLATVAVVAVLAGANLLPGK